MTYCIIMPRLARDKHASYAFPVGMAYVSASIKATGRQVVTYNLNYKDKPVKDILNQLITEYSIDVIATGGLTTQYPELREILETAKKIKPNIITWVGGGIITASPIPAMEALEFADYGMIGEGEVTICELAEAVEGKRAFSTVDGILYRDPVTHVWTVTNPRKEIEDLDSLPFPDYDGFEYDQVINKVNFELNAEHSGMVSFSRSCPFNCTFCFHPSGTKYRKRSLKNILLEVDYLIKYYDIQSLYISDELFALRGEDLDQFCEEMKKRNLSFVVSLRVDMVNQEMIHKLKESGCRLATFGLESADNRILKSMNKHITIQQIEQALELCLQEDLPTQGNFIFGDEAETVETYHNTLNWWKNHPQYNIKLGNIFVYPGSILYTNACKKGIISNEVEYIRNGCPQINVSKLSDEEYQKMLLEISLAFSKGTEKISDCTVSYATSGLVDISATCPHCGKRNIWNNREAFRPVTKLSCDHCGKIIDIYPLDYADCNQFVSNFRRLCKHNVALWGAVGSLEAMHEYMEEAWNEAFAIVDSSVQKQGLELYGHKISSPDIISSQQMDIVIITITSQAAATIYRTIQEKYPSVKKIMYLGDLLDPQLQL